MSHFQILIKIDSAIWASLLNDDSKDFKMNNTETTGGLHLDPGTWILGTGITSRQRCRLTEILSMFQCLKFPISTLEPCPIFNHASFHTVLGLTFANTRNTFYKGQGDFQLVCPLEKLPK